MNHGDKFLLGMFKGVTAEHLLMIGWLGAACFFAFAMLWQWQRSQQRNFRPSTPAKPQPTVVSRKPVEFKTPPKLGSGGVENTSENKKAN